MKTTLEETIKINFEKTLENIENAASLSGRNSNEVKLVVVTKAQPLDKVRAVVLAGAKMLGENYPEEASEKIRVLKNEFHDIEWHMIGHLQSRKIKYIVNDFDIFQALDSLSLAEKLDSSLSTIGRVLPVLIEVNVGGEESKYGWPAWDQNKWSEILVEIEKITRLPHIKIMGCMTMPPVMESSEKSRVYFSKLRNLSHFLKKNFPDENWSELSMGTSSDYAIAIEEGATYVRIGSAILGERTKKV